MDLDPAAVTTAEEFVAQLKRLRAWSGLTYRQIQRNAAMAGRSLPSSTLADILRRDTLPREDQVIALVLACGGDVDTWLAVRKRIAADAGYEKAAAKETTSTEGAPLGERRHRDGTLRGRWLWGRWWARYGVIAALITIVVATVSSGSVVDKTYAPAYDPVMPAATSEVPPTPPAPGRYLIRLVHSNLCLSERRTDDTGYVYQADCSSAFPARSLEYVRDGLYRITTDHPAFGPGCMGVNERNKGLVGDGYCGTPGMEELLRLEPVTSPRTGFRLRPAHSGKCLGVDIKASWLEWSNIWQMTCEDHLPGQVFAFESV